MDREKKAVDSKKKGDVEEMDEASPANGGLLANAKISADALKKLTGEE